MYYHASMFRFVDGDNVVPGMPPNFFEEPVDWVYLSDNLQSAEFWEEFLGGETMAEKLGYWPEVFLYEVVPEGELEPDSWCVHNNVPGCFMSQSPLRVVRRIR